jgi:hypothetical protein
MDMTRDFLNGILALNAPNEIDYQGRKFVDKQLHVVPQEAVAAPLETSTLTSIVDYITSGTDAAWLPANDKFVIHVAGHDSVELYKELNADKARDHLLSASFEGNEFPYGRFIPIENFIIDLQSLFVQDENTEALLTFVGSVKNDSSVEQSDDGVSQKATVRQGISLAKNIRVPNPVNLKPYRTFSEIDQPQSAFVFRLRKDDSQGVTAALFEADGAAWKHEAIEKISGFFQDALEGQPVIILA